MTLQQLETFFWAVTLSGFSAAAKRLHVTQSTVSMRIRELEQSLGVELFDRRKKAARLTPKGRDLFEYASRLVSLAAEIEHRAAAPESVTGIVRLGVAEVISITWLPNLIRELTARFPLVNVEIDEGLAGELMRGLRGGALDLVMTPGSIPEPNLRALSLGKVEFAWMASPMLNLREKRLVAPDLAAYPIIGLTRESYHFSTIQSWFDSSGSRCRYISRCKSMIVAASLTAAQLGVSFLPILCFQDELRRGSLEVLNVEPVLAPVEFIAAVSIDEFHPLARRVAELAVEVSTFN